MKGSDEALTESRRATAINLILSNGKMKKNLLFWQDENILKRGKMEGCKMKEGKIMFKCYRFKSNSTVNEIALKLKEMKGY